MVTPPAISRHCSDFCVYVEVAGRAAGFEDDLTSASKTLRIRPHMMHKNAFFVKLNPVTLSE